MRVGVVIPALDEEEALPLVLQALPRALVHDLVVVDNGSRDGTAEAARRHGARVVREERRGYGSACLAGIRALRPCDVVVFLDADHSDHPEELPLLLAPIERGEADLVIGTRMVRRESRRALLPQARFGNRLAALLLRLLYGGRATDLGPFRAIRREALARLRMDDRDFGWTAQMQARAFRLGLSVVEVPVSYRERVGRSKITGTVSGTVRAGWKILFTLARERLRPRPRDERAGAAREVTACDG